MSDDQTKTGTLDRARINLNQPYELRNWALKFGVSNKQLVDAVKLVGDEAAVVEEHLRSTQ